MEWRRILLVGFMGSGKTSTGRILAGRLNWTFRDFDQVIEGRVGDSIRRIFEDYGEPAFRAMEGRVAMEALALNRVVLASGGGWPCRPGRMETLPPATLSVWLRASPETCVKRASGDPGSRPLLRGGEAVERARALLKEREPYYRLSRWTVESEGRDPDEVAEEILRRLND